MYKILKKLADKRNVSISKIEEDLGFARGSLYKWDINIPSVKKVKSVADYLSVTVDELISEDEKMEV